MDPKNHKIEVPILLTAVSGKIRIKDRLAVNEYGKPVATRRDGFKQSNYIEWQVGYDVVKNDIKKIAGTSLPDTSFIGANSKEKALYELSEYLYYFYKWGVLTNQDLSEVADYLSRVSDDSLIDGNPELQITRNHPISKEVNGFLFDYTQVKYPLLIHKFNNCEIIAEIKVTEKQYAVGVQPMLYLCFPITELHAKTILVGRCAELKEVAYFDITKDNIKIFVEVLKIFGILSKSHRHDVIEIVKTMQR